MKFIQTHATGSDCTAPYDVTDYKARTVREFIEELKPYLASEWGDIKVVRPGDFLFSSRCEFNKGVFKSELPSKLLDLEIKEVKAAGGWGNMDYLIFCR